MLSVEGLVRGLMRYLNLRGGNYVPEFHLAKQGNYFIPATQQDQVKCLKISQGEVVRAKSIDQRNYEFHKKFFALIQFAYENLPETYDGYFTDVEDFREALLVAIGWRTSYKSLKGETVHKAKSVSYSAVGQERFEKIYSRCLDVICRMIGVEESEVMDELMNWM